MEQLFEFFRINISSFLYILILISSELLIVMNVLQTLLGDDGVLLFPSSPTTAKHHYEPFLHPYNFAYWAIFNVLKLPVTQVPLGLSKDGLPLGIQVLIIILTFYIAK